LASMHVFSVLAALVLAATPRLDAPWLHKAAELAGFHVSGHNDTAWVVHGRSPTGFYLWATRRQPEPRPLFDRLANVPIYGTGKRVAWRAQGLTVWLEYGPSADATLPPRGRLAELVVVTLRLPRSYRPIAMMRMPYGPRSKCRSSRLLRPACPRRIPRIPGWNTYPSYGNPVTGTFGIERIVEAAAVINPKIHLIAGGFHLVVAPDDVIARVVTSLKDKFKVENVAPGHCTGEPMFAALKKAFGDRYLYAGLGTSLPLASSVGSDMRRGEVPALDDLTTYRKLASREDQN